MSIAQVVIPRFHPISYIHPIILEQIASNTIGSKCLYFAGIVDPRSGRWKFLKMETLDLCLKELISQF